VRIALAGAGMVSAHHLRAWRSVPETEVVALADPLLSRARQRAAEFGIGAVYDDAEVMLDAVRPDALDIAAGHGAHRALCVAAARRGIAILCQKPLAPSLAEAARIVAEVVPRVRLMVHENWRYRPWYVQTSKWIEAHAIGLPIRLELDVRSSGFVPHDGQRPALERQPMLADVEHLMIGEVLVHHLDVACHLLGPLTVVGASRGTTPEGVRGETDARIELAGNVARAAVSGNLACPEAPVALTDTMRVFGSDGEIRLDGGRLVLQGRESVALAFDLDAGYQASYDAAIAHFADALRRDLPFATPPEIHLHVLSLVEAAYRVSSTGA
jgi:predicted dehydrogenase